ncbi:MAG: hypothetical protein QGM50_04430 [Anaerolineae bacterium]|nr:hypothetical protein [Anaerolineae bacterium]MDK1118020.1 hypothetical protein [Anaerolineae bacterium]
MNILAAIIAGVVATMVFSMIMVMAPKMGMPKMDIVGMLGSMFGKPNLTLGWMMHLMLGIIFALLYAYLWSTGIGVGNPIWVTGLIFGAVHWLITGMIMGMIPMMHAGIKSGSVKAPGVWMTNNGGMMAFVGGLIGHMVFGLVLILVYNLF